MTPGGHHPIQMTREERIVKKNIINRPGITGRYPYNLEKALEKYTKGQTKNQ